MKKNKCLLLAISAMVRKLILFILLPNPHHMKAELQGITLLLYNF